MVTENETPATLNDPNANGNQLPLDYDRLLFERHERLKELSAINRTTGILKEGKPLEDSLQQVAMILPPAWQYPDYTAARIKYEDKEYRTANFIPTQWLQQQTFETIDGKKGLIEVVYLKEFMTLDEGPFMTEERQLINNLASIITGYLNSVKAKMLFSGTRNPELSVPIKKEGSTPIPESKQLLRKFLNKNNIDRDVYHDLMLFKVKEILLIANLYDAYSIEKEGRFSEYVLGEYHTLSLTSIPRITGVSSFEEAREELTSRHFDMIIVMMGVDKNSPLEISAKVKKEYPYIPVYLLLNNNSDIALLREKPQKFVSIDKAFVWNGDSRIFFAMIKNLEDKINAENDTRYGLVRVILLVEDSPVYYSRYMPM